MKKVIMVLVAIAILGISFRTISKPVAEPVSSAKNVSVDTKDLTKAGTSKEVTSWD